MFTDPKVQALWDAGKIRAAYEASSVPSEIAGDGPFRDQLQALALAQRYHEHGELAWHAARYSEMETAMTRAFELRRSVLGDGHVDSLRSQVRLAAAIGARDPSAVALFEKAIGAMERVVGPDGIDVALARRELALCLSSAGDGAGARVQLDGARPVMDRELGAEHEEAFHALRLDGVLCYIAADLERAIMLGEQAATLGLRIWSKTHPFVASAEVGVVLASVRLRRLDGCRKRVKSACKQLEAGYGEHPAFAMGLMARAVVNLHENYGYQDVVSDLERALAIYSAYDRPTEAAATRGLLDRLPRAWNSDTW